jgi:hypothetical protein
VFAHHVNGDGRGAATLITEQEWGGASGFEANRPNWEEPIHQLMVDNGVTIFFQGHDHIFSREVIDGVVYQSTPNPADHSYWAYNCTSYSLDSTSFPVDSDYGVLDVSQNAMLPSSGFINVTVNADDVQVDYIRTYRDIDLQTNPNGHFNDDAANGETAFSYTIDDSGDIVTDPSSDSAFECIDDNVLEGHIYNS